MRPDHREHADEIAKSELRAFANRYIERNQLPADYWSKVEALVLTTLDDIAALRLARGEHCLVVGVSGGPGTGKSTLSGLLASVLAWMGARTEVLSLDDLYLEKIERLQRARHYHPLFVTRGVPGTHDVEHGLTILERARAGCNLVLPRFNKAEDEPWPDGNWHSVQGPLDVVIFEGWLIKAPPQDPHLLVDPVNLLEEEEDPKGEWRRKSNDLLASDYRRLFNLIDYTIFLEAQSIEKIREWRQSQEVETYRHAISNSRSGAAIMSPKQLTRFVDHFERILAHMRECMPAIADRSYKIDHERKYCLHASRQRRIGRFDSKAC